MFLDNLEKKTFEPINYGSYKVRQCTSHSFCNDSYEFNDQTVILKRLSQPYQHSQALNYGESLIVPPTHPPPGENYSIQCDYLTEEALDDWIAQSMNRPIISFVDPYKKFHCPESLVNQMKYRYRKWIKSKERDHEKKKLYFDFENKQFQDQSACNSQRYAQPQGQNKKKKLENNDLQFKCEKLQPKMLQGTSISTREAQIFQQFKTDFLKKQEIYQQQQSFMNQQQRTQFNISNQAPTRQRNASIILNNTNNNNTSSLNTSYSPSKQALQQNRRIEMSPIKGQTQFSNEGSPLKGDRTKSVQFQGLNNQSSDNKAVNKSFNSNASIFQNRNNISMAQSIILDRSSGSERTILKNSHNHIIQQPHFSSEKDYLKYIQSKVEKLLEDEVEKHVKINNNFTLSYDQHVQEIDEIDNKKDKNNMDNIDFSFMRGVRRIKKGTLEAAIQCFRQALNFNTSHFPTIFNLGCVYERTQKFETAKKWFDVASKFLGISQANQIGIKYGFALCCYKTGQYEEAYNYIDDIINNMEEPKAEYKYLRCLCSKWLNNFDQAAKDYSNFIKFTCPKNFIMLMHLMFAMIFKRIRKQYDIKIDTLVLCEFNSLVYQILASKQMQPNLSEHWDLSNQQWLPSLNVSMILGNSQILALPQQQSQHQPHQQQNSQTPQITHGQSQAQQQQPQQQQQQILQQQVQQLATSQILRIPHNKIIDKLKSLSFFQRFATNDIRTIFPHLELVLMDQSRVIFPKSGLIYIIAAGHVAVYDHRQQFDQPNIVGYYSEGDIIGYNEKDNRISENPDIWFVTLINIEMLVIPRQYFQELWDKHHQIANKMAIFKFLQENCLLITGMSELTLYKISFELVQIVNFVKDEIVFNDGECVDKYHYIELKKISQCATTDFKQKLSNKIDRFRFSQKKMHGLYIIKQGELYVETLSPQIDNLVLGQGDFVGENQIFSTVGYSRFGIVRAKSHQVECYFIPRSEFHKINSLDKEIMKKNCRSSQYFKKCQALLYKQYKTQKNVDE